MVSQDSAAAAIFNPRTRMFQRGGIHSLPVTIFRERLHKFLRRDAK
jgi:hypothetical protein